ADPVVQDAFRQYVLYLAFQLISVWFMGIRLSDRKHHVRTIIQQLVQSNIDQLPHLTEQTEVCLDMLLRCAYSDCSLSPQSSKLADLLLKDAVTKTWVQGNALITMRASRHTGWAETKIRRPSGVVSFLHMIQNQHVSTQDTFEEDMNDLSALFTSNLW